MKEEALKLADELDTLHQYVPSKAPAMIRRLVEELDKQTKPTITKVDDKVVAVTMTDDDHRIAEVLWEAPKPLSDEEIGDCVDDYFGLMALQHKYIYDIDQVQEYGLKLARAIEERHGIK